MCEQSNYCSGCNRFRDSCICNPASLAYYAPDEVVPECPVCQGEGCYLGTLAILQWFRCRQCGAEFSVKKVAQRLDITITLEPQED